jgi:Mitochondrial carrier protein
MTWTQNLIASVAGAVASIIVAAPLDMIKTRIQNANFEKKKTSGVTIVRNLLRDEGAMAVFKGFMPKVCRNYCPRLLLC